MSRGWHDKTRKESGAPARVERKTEKRAARQAGALESAGNNAVGKLLEAEGTAKSLSPELRARMEQAYGVSFESVRIRDDAAGNEAARAVDAVAFTSGEEIVLGEEAPAAGTPQAEALLAHELAHVVQQRRASAVHDGEVNGPNDSCEQEAEQAAAQAISGQRAQAGARGAAPPAVQRQRRDPDGATREEVQQAIQQFLERARQADPETDLRHSEHVRTVLQNFVMAGGPMVFVNLQDILSNAPNDPAEIARRIARQLPSPYPRRALERLGGVRAAGPTPSFPQRVGDLVRRTAPGGREIPPEMLGEDQQARAEREAQLYRSLTGTPEPTGIGPVNVDVLRLARIAQGLPKAISPARRREPPPASRSFPEVESAIQAIPTDTLTPAEARGTDRAGEFADAQEFARDVARQIDTAQQSGQDTVTIRLGANYNQVRDRAAMRAAVEDIIARVRAALPHHGSSVTNIDVYFGENLVTRGRRRSE